MSVRSYVVDLTDTVRLSQAYFDGLREMGLLLKTPDSLGTWEKIFIRFRLPNQVRVVISAIVVGVVGDGTYAVQLPQNSDSRRLLEIARRHISAESPNGGLVRPRPGNTATGKPQTLKARHEETLEEDTLDEDTLDEDTLDEDDVLGDELTPTDEVLAQSFERFDRWLVAKEAAPPLDTAVMSAQRAAARPATASMGKRIQVGFPSGSTPEQQVSREEELWALALNQKKKMAVSGQEAERKAFMADPDPSVQVWVLRNPNISTAEVEEYSAASNLASEAVTFLTHNPRWAISPRVALNLASNERTPDELVPRLLAVLGSGVLKELVADKGASDRLAESAAQVLASRE